MIMHTVSGVRFDLVNPRMEDVRLSDIATHLSNINRFAGAVRWDVASHSFLAALLVPVEHGLEARLRVLLHDAHEAYTGDLTTPMKRTLAYLGGFKVASAIQEIQADIDRAINCAAGFPGWGQREDKAVNDLVKQYDALALEHERRHFMSAGPIADWPECPAAEDTRREADALIAMIQSWKQADETAVAKAFVGCVKNLLEQADIGPAETFLEGV